MESKFVYVAVVGTQFMGTFQPLMMLTELYGPMKSVFLLTSINKDNEEHLAKFAEKFNLGPVEFVHISDKMDGPDSALAALEKIAKEAAANGRRICLDIQGGFNFLGAAAILTLEKYRPIYAQTTKEYGVICDTENETWIRRRLPKAAAVQDILDLQRINYRQLKKNPDVCPSRPLKKHLAECKINAPKDAMENVEIGGIVFDYVWNPGDNRLHLFKDWRFSTDDRARLERERDFNEWSRNRNRCGSLHDKDVTALVWDSKSAERLSQANIKTIYINKDNDQALDAQKIADALNKKLPKISEGPLQEPKIEKPSPLKDNTLVTALSNPPISTLVAICSHKPEHLVLCYDHHTAEVARRAEKIKEMAKELGLKSVELVRLGVEGFHPFSVLPDLEKQGNRVIVNISPGTKAQGNSLARWAARHGHEVWSLYNAKRVCAPLTEAARQSEIPMEMFDPALVCGVLEKELMDAGKTHQELNLKDNFYDAMLAFMRKADEASLDISAGFEKGRLEIGEDYLKRTRDKQWELRLNGKKYQFSRDGGAWFEKLCARAMMNAGASMLRGNLKLAWNEENLRKWLKKYPDSPGGHQLEVDVLASYKGHLILLSAKSYELLDAYGKPGQDGKPLATRIYATDEAKSAASYFGPFTLSVVADLGRSKSMLENRTCIIGWRELCRPEALGKLLDGLGKSKGTTSGGEAV